MSIQGNTEQSETVILTNPLNKSDVYHTRDCHNVQQIVRTIDKPGGNGYRDDLTAEQVEKWGKRECRRCQRIKDKEMKSESDSEAKQ